MGTGSVYLDRTVLILVVETLTSLPFVTLIHDHTTLPPGKTALGAAGVDFGDVFDPFRVWSNLLGGPLIRKSFGFQDTKF
jgi:hypothetical protein